jgi:hypothetical protein
MPVAASSDPSPESSDDDSLSSSDDLSDGDATSNADEAEGSIDFLSPDYLHPVLDSIAESQGSVRVAAKPEFASGLLTGMPPKSEVTVPCGLHPDIEQLFKFAQTQNLQKLDNSTGVLVALRVEPKVFTEFLETPRIESEILTKLDAVKKQTAYSQTVEDMLKAIDRRVRGVIRSSSFQMGALDVALDRIGDDNASAMPALNVARALSTAVGRESIRLTHLVTEYRRANVALSLSNVYKDASVPTRLREAPRAGYSRVF